MNRRQHRLLILLAVTFAVLLHVFLCEWGGPGMWSLPSTQQVLHDHDPDSDRAFERAERTIIWKTNFTVHGSTYFFELAADHVDRDLAIVAGVFLPLALLGFAGYLALGQKK